MDDDDLPDGMEDDDLPYGAEEDVARGLNVDPLLARGIARDIARKGGVAREWWIRAERARILAASRPGGTALDSDDETMLRALAASADASGALAIAELQIDSPLGTDADRRRAAVERAVERGTLEPRDGGRVYQLRAWPGTAPGATPTR